MVITVSAPAQASAAEAARAPPPVANRSVAYSLKSNPDTACPALIRFWAIGSPILPSPMKPIFAIRPSPWMSGRLLARGHQRETQINCEQHQLGHDHPNISAVDLRKQGLDRRHGDHGGQPHYRPQRRRQ